MARKRVRVNIALSPNRKERWVNYAEENNKYDNLSNMIRQLVEKDIKGGNESSSEIDIDFNDGEILSGINRLENAIEDVDSRVGVVEREVVSDNDFSVLQQVQSALPAADMIPADKPMGPPDNAIITTELAESTGIDEMELIEVLRFLDEFHPGIKSASFDGQRFSWKAKGTPNYLGGDSE